MIFDFVVVAVSSLTIASLASVSAWTIGCKVVDWWDNL